MKKLFKAFLMTILAITVGVGVVYAATWGTGDPAELAGDAKFLAPTGESTDVEISNGGSDKSSTLWFSHKRYNGVAASALITMRGTTTTHAELRTMVTGTLGTNLDNALAATDPTIANNAKYMPESMVTQNTYSAGTVELKALPKAQDLSPVDGVPDTFHAAATVTVRGDNSRVENDYTSEAAMSAEDIYIESVDEVGVVQSSIICRDGDVIITLGN